MLALGGNRRDGGTGRRSGLKIRRPSGLGGSTPPPGTTESKEVSSFSLKNRNGPFVVPVCAKSLGQRLIPLKRIPRLSRKTLTQLRRRKRPLPLYLDGIRGSGAVRAAKPYARLLRYELQPVVGTTIERLQPFRSMASRAAAAK